LILILLTPLRGSISIESIVENIPLRELIQMYTKSLSPRGNQSISTTVLWILIPDGKLVFQHTPKRTSQGFIN
jgi:hypothetical protein